MKRKTVTFAALLLALLILLPACGSQSYSDSASGGSSGGGGSANSAPGSADSVMTEMGDGGFAGESSISQNDSSATEHRKIIWNASMDIEAEDAVVLHGRLSARAAELGGYEYNNDISHHERWSVVRATYKIPPQNLQAFLAYAGEEGKVINRSLSSDDITESYYDAQLRLESTRKSLEQYYKFMDDAQNLDEVLRLQRVIDGIITDIEAFEGRLRMWDVLTDMATVSILVRQENDPLKIQREINWNALSAEDMGYLIRSGFVAVSSGFLTVVQWLAVIVLITAPVWIPAALVLWFWRRRIRKRRAAMPQPPPQPMEPAEPTEE
jgi:hypothetical protein